MRLTIRCVVVVVFHTHITSGAAAAVTSCIFLNRQAGRGYVDTGMKNLHGKTDLAGKPSKLFVQPFDFVRFLVHVY